MRYKGAVTFVFLLGIIGGLIIEPRSQDRNINWDDVLKAAEIYFASPSPEKAHNLYLALPNSQLPPGERGELFSKVTDYLYGHLYELVKHLSEDRNAVEVTFRLYYISDGGFTEELYNVIGDLVDNNPGLFLEEFKYCPLGIEVVCCGMRINRLYANGLKKEHNEELEKRIKTLGSVKDKHLIALRDNCIAQIKHCFIKE